MKIHCLIAQLEGRLKATRHYANEEREGLPDVELRRYAESLKQSDNCLGCPLEIGVDQYAASDVCLLGPGRQRQLGEEWNIQLPEDYLAFCSKFDDYLFIGEAFVVINSADAVRDSVTAAREVAGCADEDGHRLFNFAAIIGMPGYYSFRWSLDRATMEVVFVWDYGDVGANELLGKGGQRFVSDTDFTSWLARMIETEANTLYPIERWPMADGEYVEDDYPYFKRLA